MSNWILFGIVIGFGAASLGFLCFQAAMLFFDVRNLIKSINQLTDGLQPSLNEVNHILNKSNLALDEVGHTYKNTEESLKEAKGKVAQLGQKMSISLKSFQVGVNKGLEVLKNGGDSGN